MLRDALAFIVIILILVVLFAVTGDDAPDNKLGQFVCENVKCLYEEGN